MNWTSVKDSLPEFEKTVLFTDGEKAWPGYRYQMILPGGLSKEVWCRKLFCEYSNPYDEYCPKCEKSFKATHWILCPERPTVDVCSSFFLQNAIKTPK